MSGGLVIHHDPIIGSSFSNLLSESLLIIENKRNKDLKELQLLELDFKAGTCHLVESLQLPTSAKVACNQKTLYIGTSNQLECFPVEAITKNRNFNSVEKRAIRNHTPVETSYTVSDKIFTVSM